MQFKSKFSHDSVIGIKSFQFAIEIVKLTKRLTNEKEFVMSNQLLRSGTAVGAIYREAKNAESTKDFIHKLAMSQKEADESIFWLDLLFETDQISETEYHLIRDLAMELMRMISSALITSKKKLG